MTFVPETQLDPLQCFAFVPPASGPSSLPASSSHPTVGPALEKQSNHFPLSDCLPRLFPPARFQDASRRAFAAPPPARGVGLSELPLGLVGWRGASRAHVRGLEETEPLEGEGVRERERSRAARRPAAARSRRGRAALRAAGRRPLQQGRRRSRWRRGGERRRSRTSAWARPSPASKRRAGGLVVWGGSQARRRESAAPRAARHLGVPLQEEPGVCRTKRGRPLPPTRAKCEPKGSSRGTFAAAAAAEASGAMRRRRAARRPAERKRCHRGWAREGGKFGFGHPHRLWAGAAAGPRVHGAAG